MHLARIRLRNYWGYEETDLELPPDGLVVVIGPNNTGKTALISVLDLIADKPVQLAKRTEGRSTWVSATFVLDDSTRDGLLAVCLPSPGSSIAARYLRELTVSWLESGSQLRLSEIALSDPEGRPMPVLRGEPNGTIRWTPTSHLSADGSTAPDFSAGGANTLMLGECLKLIDASLANLYAAWAANFFHFTPARPAPAGSRLQPAERLDASGSNLANALLWLATNEPHEWAALGAVMTELIPDLGELRAPAQGTVVSAGFYDRFLGKFVDITRCGTGVGELLMMAYVGSHVQGNGVTVLEEPENHLHHGAQRRLLRYLLAWSVGRQVILTTHSSVFLDVAPSEVSIFEVSRNEGISRIQPVLRERSQLLSRLGVSVADALSGRRALIVEGPSDVTILDIWFGDLLHPAGVQVIKADGCGAASQIRSFSRWISEWLDSPTPAPRRIVFLRDRDELMQSEIDRLEKTGIVRVLPRREIENYLLDPEAVSAVLSEVARIKVLPVTASEWIEEAIDANRNTVLLKRVAAVCQRSWRLLGYDDVRDLLKIVPNPTLRDALTLVPHFTERDDVRAFVTETWEREEAMLTQEWDSGRASLAAGSDVLDHVWKKVGRRYGKQRDALLLLREVSPPVELRELLEDLLDSLRGDAPMAL